MMRMTGSEDDQSQNNQLLSEFNKNWGVDSNVQMLPVEFIQHPAKVEMTATDSNFNSKHELISNLVSSKLGLNSTTKRYSH